MEENHTMITYHVKMVLKYMKQGFQILVVGSFPFISTTTPSPDFLPTLPWNICILWQTVTITETTFMFRILQMLYNKINYI